MRYENKKQIQTKEMWALAPTEKQYEHLRVNAPKPKETRK